MSSEYFINVRKQKMKIANHKNHSQTKLLYLAVYGSYNELVVGLFNGPQLISYRVAQETRLSAFLIPVLDELLSAHSVLLTDLSFIAVVDGPGSFSSLRALLASVNGIAAGRNIPLIGCDGLMMFFSLLRRSLPGVDNYTALVVFNAYNNEHFYYLATVQSSTVCSPVLPPHYGPAEPLIEIMEKMPSPQWVIGNSTAPFLAALAAHGLEECVYTPRDILSALSEMATELWSSGQTTTELAPRYLKKTAYKKI